MKTASLPVLAFVLSAAVSARAAEGQFRPETAFPHDTLAYISIGKLERFIAGARSTLLGRITSHPGVAAALGKLPEWLRAQGGGRFQGLLDDLALVQGELSAVALRGAPGGPPRLVVAVELGANREAILRRLGELDAELTGVEKGEDASSMVIRDHKVVVWPLGEGVLASRAVLGTHAVFALPSEAIAPVILAYVEPPERSLKDAPFLAALRPRVALDRGEALIALDLKAILAAYLPPPREGELPSEPEQFLAASGLNAVSAVGLGLGFQDGGSLFKLHLATPGGTRGVLGAVARALAPVPRETIEAGLARVPAEATGIQAARVESGRLLGGVARAVKAGAPQAAAGVDALVQWMESSFGVTLEGDLEPLPPIDVIAFTMVPPAGGIFEDQVILARAEEFAPYEKLLKQASGEAGLKTIDAAGRTVQRSRLVAFTALDGGWVACSGTTAAVRRYLSHYARAPKVADSPEALKSAREKLEGAPAAVLRGGRIFIAAWNTLVSLLNLAAAPFEAYLSPLGVDPGLLPAGEEFLDAAKDGFLRLEKGADGLTLHGHRAVSGSGALTLVAVGSVMAGFLVPTLMSARGRAGLVHCQNNLREISKLGLLYADSGGTRHFPHAPGGGIAALQKLADSFDEMSPQVLVCPASGQKPAEPDAEGKLNLGPGNTSYEMAPWRLSPTAFTDAILVFDRAPVHQGKRNVAYVDGSVMLVDEAEFQRQLLRDRERFAGDLDAPAKARKAPAAAKKPAAPKQALKQAPVKKEEKDGGR